MDEIRLGLSKDKGRMRVRREEVAKRRVLIFRATFAGALLLAAASAYFAWRSWSQAPEAYDIILLTTESTRLDAIGPETTPNLWRLAGRGSRFTQHRGSSAWTTAGAVSTSPASALSSTASIPATRRCPNAGRCR